MWRKARSLFYFQSISLIAERYFVLIACHDAFYVDLFISFYLNFILPSLFIETRLCFLLKECREQ